jgi:hypothetical protein
MMAHMCLQVAFIIFLFAASPGNRTLTSTTIGSLACDDSLQGLWAAFKVEVNQSALP